MSETAPPEAPGPAAPQPPGRYPFWGYKDLILLFGLALPIMVVSALIVQIAALFVPGGRPLPAAVVLASQFLAYGLWFLILWALIRFRYGRPFWGSLGWVTPRHGTLRYALLGPVLALGVGVAGALLQTPEMQMPMMELLRDRISIVLVGVFAVSLGPLCEELAFRGFFLPLLARSLGPAAGVVLTAVFFSMLHGPQYAWSWRHLLLITSAGVAFGVVRLRTGSTSAATVMHATYNLTFFAAYLTHLEETGSPW